MIRTIAATALAALVSVLAPAAGASAEPRHGIAMHGEPALPADFTALPYARPDAPKGGRIVFGVQGTFDTLNTFSVRGIAAQGIAPPTGLVTQALMARSYDEPFSLYGLVAESIETPDDRSWVTFRLNPKARFSDGRPVTADDVLFTWALLKTKGKPNFRNWYAKAVKAEALDPHTVRFDLTGADDRELPLILALMPVLPRHATDADRFEETTLAPPIGSGPYVVAQVKPGESITYRRNPDYWGKDLPISRGLYNPDEIRFDYYRDANSLFEAFKGGLYDVRIEDSPTRWMTGYDFPAVTDGRIVRDPVTVRTPKGMNALVFNTRRPVFADARVREALGLLFDFDWVNRNLFYGVYQRTTSYFQGSDLASTGRPASARERELLAHFPDAVRPDILDGTWRPAQADGSGRDRELARKALDLLDKAGWTLHDGVLRRAGSGEPMTIEFLAASRVQERLALNFAQSLQRIGVTMRVRLVDDVQYWRRLASFDFDMIQFIWGASPSPGNEQYGRWSARAADRQGSLNYAGARNPAIEAMIDAMLSARERDDFVAATRALDRVLLSQFYVIPLFNQPEQWVAHSAAVKRPAVTPLFGFQPETLWRETP
ncbi:extracellular solute-binding protein [Alsobacter sp. SYSU M60028]|uniref:Extracellular solute-binding protein n=1 Tax=Alsobacter ponti TaxID=2962936 RepID=A0ABT1LHZ1_9HYPH|nr:extracellular solute-binding protein [Alsobacter ponti]MCP8940738.1 extracellular solute-binding protein [Alsobacter ponti]